MESPSEKLAAKIVERMRAENLIGEDPGKKLAGPLAVGKVRSEDWQVAIELQLEAGAKK